MTGLTLLGADAAERKKNAPYIGLGVGALAGVLVSVWLTRGKYLKQILRVGGVRIGRVSRIGRVGLGAAAGAAVGGGIGYAVKKKA